jgi:hypothetical protein
MIVTRNKFSKPNSPTARARRISIPAGGLLYLSLLAALAAALISSGCSFSEVSTDETPTEPVVLVDQTGKEWDVTSAVRKYGFELKRFEFGLGPYAIAPMIEPAMLSPGDAGYPISEGTFLVIGTSINGDTRAYGRFDIVSSEVVDDYIGGVPLAVAY